MPSRTYGPWVRGKRLGGGGNGDVYRCRRVYEGEHEEAAIKVLRRNEPGRDRISRFRNEINFLLTRGDTQGVLPLLDSDLPDDPAGPSWYVMPLAVPLPDALGSAPDLSDVVLAIAHVGETLARLASEEVWHRDVKPANLFRLNDEYVPGDFGLVSYPEGTPDATLESARPAVLHGTRDASRRRQG